MYGFGGDDLYYLDNVGDAAVEEPGAGHDTVITSVSYTLAANLETLLASVPEATTALVLTGNGAANHIAANDGSNVIDGKGGNDTLNGWGGADSFVFSTALDAASNVDRINDFEVSADRILLGGATGEPFAALATGALGVFAFRRAAAAVDADDRIIYDPATGALSYDADGAGGAAAVRFASLNSGLDLTSAHFTVTGAPNGLPSITSGTAASVAENAPVSTIVYQAVVSDPDGDSILFRLGGADAGRFTIDNSGAVRLVSPADFETKSSYQFTVFFGDSAGDAGSRAVTLSVTDVAEGAPIYLLTEVEPNDTAATAQAIDRSRLAPNGDPIVPDASLPSATITGSISTATDQDRFSITLNAGELLILDVDGTATLDSELRVFGPNGTEVARNDDPGSFDPGSSAHEGLSHNMDSVIRVRAPTTGTYTFQIASFKEENGTTSQGGYTLHVLVGPAATAAQINEENIQALLSGSSWDTLALTYGFTNSGADYGAGQGTEEIAAGMSALNALQKTVVHNILAQYANLTNLTFSELFGAPGSAQLRYALSLDPDTAHAYHPGPGDGGDSWYNSNKYNNPSIGNYQYMTFLHETGHALGLKHGHESPALSPDRDSLEYSVMTYRSYIGASVDDGSGFSNETGGYPQTPMMYDIAALQRLYGADFTFNGGDSVYSWNYQTGVFSINGVAQWTPLGTRIFMTIWDGGGTDTYDATGYPYGSTIDLRPGEWSTLASFQLANLGDGHMARGNVANALLYNGDPRSLIENAIGSGAPDQIIANEAANRLTGAGGADTFRWSSNGDVGLGASADTITDFVPGDKVDLQGIDAITGTAANEAFSFVGTAAFSGTAGELRYEVVGNQARIFGDTNGDALADFMIALDNVAMLQPSDFTL
jgi:serralysin